MRAAVSPTARVAVAATFLALAAATAIAQEPGSRRSREFAQTSASSDQFEIMAAETVLAQSTNKDVRDFASHLLQDHQELGKKLRAAAVRDGLKPPEMAMSADQAQWLGALQSAGPQELDGLFLRQQALAHQSALVVEQGYAQSGDRDLRQFALSATPQLQSHSELATRLQARLGQ